MEHKYSSPVVVKYGGNAFVEGHDPLLESAVAAHLAGEPIVLVHGGGPEIDRWLAQRQVPTRRVDGLRVTDAPTLEVTEAVLCATINKRLVRNCAALGARAVGVSGEDGALLVAQAARGSQGEDLGFVGQVTHCDPFSRPVICRSSHRWVSRPTAAPHTTSTPISRPPPLPAPCTRAPSS